MKKSEELELEAQKEENDIKAFAIYKKAEREKNLESFQDKVFPDLVKVVGSVRLRDNGSYTFRSEKYGTVDYYPKSDKLLIRGRNSWVNNGSDFITNKILEHGNGELND